MTAVFLEMAQGWEDPGLTLAFLLAIAIIVLTRTTRIKFLVFLVLATAYFLIFRFPEVANHVNLMIYCNIVMIVAVVYSFVRYRGSATDDDYFEMIRPVLRASLILIYFSAGFHKLNGDYFNPEVSCAGTLLGNVVSTMQSRIFGVPVALVLAAGGLFVVWRLVRGTRFVTPESRVPTLLLILCVGGVLCGALIIESRLGTPGTLKLSVGLATAAIVILWELIGSLLLAVPKFQPAILLFSLTMHAVLAMVGFVDFGALAFALLFTFIPPNYYQILNEHASLRFSGLSVHRAHVYFIISVVGGVLSGIHFHIYPFLDIKILFGLLFNLAVLVFIWPILATVFSPSRRPVWGGVPVLNRRMPNLMFVFLVFLFLWGMTPYFGLRTAGNFSMFSNLRTEGNLANHLLLGSNPIKVWGYQEDVVRVIEIDDDSGEIIHHYPRPLQGHELPVVEFRKMIYEWTRSRYTVPLTFEYRGETYSTKDIVKDPVWSTEERNWEMVLMDFRVIQPDRPNQCRW